jgi:pimeloyl-ACP methyl ester carboxylesterase
MTTVAERDGRPTAPDAARAVEPTSTGIVEADDGVRIAFDCYGAGDPTLVLLPSTPIVHSRQWKGQVPYLSRHFRVITFDGRGNGRSDRPTDPEAYREPHMVGDIEAVMDDTGTDAAVLIGLCGDGVWRANQPAAARAGAGPGDRRVRGRCAAPRAATPVEGRLVVRR